MEITAGDRAAIRMLFLKTTRPRVVPTAFDGVFIRVLPLGDLVDHLFPLALKSGDMTVEILSRSLCFADGSPLFDSPDEAAAELRECAGGDLVELVKQASKLNALGAEGESDAKKNSTALISDSP